MLSRIMLVKFINAQLVSQHSKEIRRLNLSSKTEKVIKKLIKKLFTRMKTADNDVKYFHYYSDDSKLPCNPGVPIDDRVSRYIMGKFNELFDMGRQVIQRIPANVEPDKKSGCSQLDPASHRYTLPSHDASLVVALGKSHDESGHEILYGSRCPQVDLRDYPTYNPAPSGTFVSEYNPINYLMKPLEELSDKDLKLRYITRCSKRPANDMSREDIIKEIRKCSKYVTSSDVGRKPSRTFRRQKG